MKHTYRDKLKKFHDDDPNRRESKESVGPPALRSLAMIEALKDHEEALVMAAIATGRYSGNLAAATWTLVGVTLALIIATVWG